MKLDTKTARSSVNVLTGAFQTPIPGPVELYDLTLREGEQPPGVVFTAEEKLDIARALDDFGMHWGHIGFPAASAQEMRTVKQIVDAKLKMKTSVLSRLTPNDIDISVDTGVDLVAVFIGGSDSHLFDKLRLTESEAFKLVETGVRRCRDRGGRCAFAVEDSSRTPLGRLLKLFEIAANAGAERLVFADTVGICTPSSIFNIARLLRTVFTQPIGLHLHNDLGLALANSLAGLEAGAHTVQASFTGIGERAGNTCMEELVVALKVKYGIDLGLKLDQLCTIADKVYKASGTQPSPHKPVTGRWCFSHESGIHVAGVLANPDCYQPYPPELIGRHHELMFGKHSGAQGISHFASVTGLPLSDSGRKNVLEKVKLAAERKQGMVTEEQIAEWIRTEQG